MARCEVVQIQCDRCKRVELRAPTPKKALPDLDLTYLGERVKYDDTCQFCQETIKRIIEDLKEWQREVKQPFGPTVAGNEAPPLEVAPKYSPAQPHATGTKR